MNPGMQAALDQATAELDAAYADHIEALKVTNAALKRANETGRRCVQALKQLNRVEADIKDTQ